MAKMVVGIAMTSGSDDGVRKLLTTVDDDILRMARELAPPRPVVMCEICGGAKGKGGKGGKHAFSGTQLPPGFLKGMKGDGKGDEYKNKGDGAKVCFAMVRTGSCTFGDKCTYSHDPDPVKAGKSAKGKGKAHS